MLSIIISSYKPEYFSALEKNIAETIGIPYEIIKIDNPGIMEICEAYNKGAEKSQYNHLLFLHEDVSFETKNWGEKLDEILGIPTTGVVGVAGSTYVPAVPYAWWSLHDCNYLHLNQYRGKKKVYTHKQSISNEVASLDGVFLACRKKVWQQHPFNENIKGFHGYDIDFSVRIAESYTNYVTADILINHYSGGSDNKIWFDALILQRPYYNAPSHQKIDQSKEIYFYQCFRRQLMHFKYPKNEIRKLLFEYNRPKNLGYIATVKNLIRLIN